jgi:hypothetical protein
MKLTKFDREKEIAYTISHYRLGSCGGLWAAHHRNCAAPWNSRFGDLQRDSCRVVVKTDDHPRYFLLPGIPIGSGRRDERKRRNSIRFGVVRSAVFN